MDQRIFEKMTPYFLVQFGNAASRNHSYGWEAEAAVEEARKQVADLIGATDKEIVFTSGATESNNLALIGIAEMYKEKGNHIITCVTEHKAILDTAQYLETKGCEVTYLAVDKYGMISPDELEKAITDKTILISIMTANNEIGTIQPIKEIGAIARRHGVFFHTDATQAAGRIPMDVEDMNIDLLSMSAHKLYGPKGVGAIYVRRKNPRVRISPIIHGGGHERGMRSGTLNVPGIVGLGEACRIAKECMAAETERTLKLRQRLQKGFEERIDYLHLNGHPEKRLPGNLNISFAYIEGESLMIGIEGVAVSSGSACTSASLEPSYVLRATGINDELAHSSIRFTIGRFTTEEDIDEVIRRIGDTAGRLREMSPLYEMVKEGIDLNSIHDKVIDHFNNPRNVGSLDKHESNIGTGIVGAPECGDVMKLQVKVENNKIVDAKFKTYGCGSAIASSSLATEWIKGKTIDEAMAITNADISEELSLPPVKIHCSVLAEDAIKAAIADYKKRIVHKYKNG
ncbi:hypothetical protein CHS0354_035354 [Potamilus streckersoni]|uniref:Iron-sulfur cluster assembly enzyme ISCU n=1 Tax=Potamilus streckersoni TaxID=2493646 RepID=A0AAE0S375_9BIVA|nr:hypothetical protein CHS0354_035354 [Potamilus streckersoni]